jgi:glucosamine-6-phosphate deaminase
MHTAYEGIDADTVAALSMGADELRQRCRFLTVHDSSEAMVEAMADRMVDDYLAVLDSGRATCVMIVPVGPVGQYDIIARRCVRDDICLDRLTLIVMDEYLTTAGEWIPEEDPLSFRAHIRRHLVDKLPANLRPGEVVVPNPTDLGRIPRLIARQGGVDLCYAGVGITGHLAFNDPEPGRDDPAWFAGLPTRVVRLTPETRLINSVTAAGGNSARIPFQAVTVGMKEILSAGLLRIWMNRDWQRAAIRRMLFGPVTGAFPASLVQRHPNVTVDALAPVLAPAEPGLR